MLIPHTLRVNEKFWGVTYVFERAGDEFPVHTHTEENNHITVVLHGSVRCLGHPRFEGRVIEAKPGGTIINWIAGEPHGFVALTDGATILNLLRNL